MNGITPHPDAPTGMGRSANTSLAQALSDPIEEPAARRGLPLELLDGERRGSVDLNRARVPLIDCEAMGCVPPVEAVAAGRVPGGSITGMEPA